MKASLLVWLGLLAIFVYVVSSTCPSNCSGHGRCTQGRCYCSQDGNTGITWAGDDCSYEYVDNVQTGRVYSPSQPTLTGGWVFFKYSTRPHTQAAWSLNQTAQGDCDFYLKKDKFPTRSDWDRRDISTDRTVLIITEDPAHTTWYAGVYAFATCSFTFSVTGSHECPSANCSGHGTCENGRCVCNPDYYGHDCSQVNPPQLEVNKTVSDTVAQGAWKYWFVPSHLHLNTQLRFTLVMKSANDDADLYIQIGKPPTPFDYLVANTSLTDISTIDLVITNEGEHDTYYVGVYGFFSESQASFDLTVTRISTDTDCDVLECSKHGTCAHHRCSCARGFSGDNCETMGQALVFGQAVVGYVKEDAWNYYHFDGGLDNKEIQISVTQSSAEEDCDIYIKADEQATGVDYDYSEVSSDSANFTLLIPEPSGHIWYISVLGWLKCDYRIVVNYKQAGDKCSGHGSVNTGTNECVCNNGWAGDECDQTIQALTNGQVVTGTVSWKGWKYYSINVGSSTHSLEVHLKETNAIDFGGYVWVYVSRGVPPTHRSYDGSDTQTTSEVHHVSLAAHDSNNPLFGVYYIGVYGSPLARTAQNVEYKLTAWYPHF